LHFREYQEEQNVTG